MAGGRRVRDLVRDRARFKRRLLREAEEEEEGCTVAIRMVDGEAEAGKDKGCRMGRGRIDNVVGEGELVFCIWCFTATDNVSFYCLGWSLPGWRIPGRNPHIAA